MSPSQSQQVIELVTAMLANDTISPAQAADILQQMLPPEVLQQLQVGWGQRNTSLRLCSEAVRDTPCYPFMLLHRHPLTHPLPAATHPPLQGRLVSSAAAVAGLPRRYSDPLGMRSTTAFPQRHPMDDNWPPAVRSSEGATSHTESFGSRGGMGWMVGQDATGGAQAPGSSFPPVAAYLEQQQYAAAGAGGIGVGQMGGGIGHMGTDASAIAALQAHAAANMEQERIMRRSLESNRSSFDTGVCNGCVVRGGL
jgi:hypothetical protein